MRTRHAHSNADVTNHPDTDAAGRGGNLDLTTVREASWLTIGLVVFATSVLTATLWYLMSITWQPLLVIEAAVTEGTGGLVRLTLITYVVLLAVVGGIIVRIGGLRLEDVSLNQEDLRVGVVVTVAVWFVLQLVGIISQIGQGQPVVVNSYWTTANTLAVLGLLVAQLFGNALYEEVVFRAFLLNQLRHKLVGRFPTATPRRVAVGAILGSQLIFALVHVPSRLVTSSVAAIPGSLIVVFVAGVLLATLYYRTGNLFIAIGLHALINAPTMVTGAPAVGELTALVLVVLVTLAWPWVERHIETTAKRTAATS